MLAGAISAGLSTVRDTLRLVHRSRALALDLETTGLNPRQFKVRLLSLANEHESVVLDCFANDPAPVLEALRTKVLVAHHAAFDLGFLWHLGMRDLPESICTYLLAQLLTAGRGAEDRAHGFPKLSLDACCKQWLGIELSKELQKSDWSGTLSRAQIAYAHSDVRVLPALFRKMAAELETSGLVAASEVELGALPAFVWMAQSGVPFHKPAWATLAHQSEQEQRAVEMQLDEMAPPRGPSDLFGERPRWEWSSPKQVGEVLALLGHAVDSTNDYYLAECKHPIGELLRKHRELAKRSTTYGRDWLDHVAEDGRVYPHWWQCGAASGRTSCSGPNMQQLPRGGGYKACVRAPQGRLLIKADYSQIELRLACKIAREKKMLEAYRAGQDLHTLTAALLTGKRPEDCSKQDRQIAKSANFGLLYGMGARGYQAYAKATYGLELSPEKATHYRDAFFKAYPGLAAWHGRTRNSGVMETRTLLGRRRQLPPGAPDTWRLNTPVQGSGADGLKQAMALLWQRRKECPHSWPVLAVHDEIVLETDQGEADAARAWLVRAMEDGIRNMLEPVPVAVDVSVKQTWGE